ncbi:MAG: glycolate oxidase subunit GlcF [Acidiferrobacterales bacterium]
MQTDLADFIKDTPEGREANAILRACVHCGFCTATCPTYQLLGNELDGPRGRIYLIKQVLEGHEPTTRTQMHLDRCLTCRACETTCPSGVKYGRLADIGRRVVEEKTRRPLAQKIQRRVMRAILPHESRFTPLLKLGRLVRSLLPGALRGSITRAQTPGDWPEPRHARRMLVLDGCVQPGLAPRINAATARVLDHAGISLVRAQGAGCCGALSYHLTAQAEGLDFMRRLIDAWWPHVESGVEAIVTTASGCGVVVKEYGHLLRNDERYADKAARIGSMTRDIAEVLANTDVSPLKRPTRKVAFHSPCTLQHGQKLNGVVEELLQKCGFELTPVADAYLCCGSAGTYSILQQRLSGRLLANKLETLESGAPEQIVTANIGCLVHLQSRAQVPVTHWIELLDVSSD